MATTIDAPLMTHDNESEVHHAEDDLYFSRWRASELTRLGTDTVYADHTGAALHPESLVRGDAVRLNAELLGNPHSMHFASSASTSHLTTARRAILEFLRADEAEYVVILTANATAGCRIVGEAFPFSSRNPFLAARDNHNSINGIGEFARRAGANVRSIDLDRELRLAHPERFLRSRDSGHAGLFAYPAQSNFSGVRHSLGLIETAQENGWRVLLDAASFLSTANLRLDEVHPDFVVLSLYKIIGYPTGLGALVARRDALAILDRPWFAGGTVKWVSRQHQRHLLADGAERFEDGTPSFAAAGAVASALAAARDIDRERLGRHLRSLTARTLRELLGLRHGNGRPVVEIHGPHTADARGATIALTIRDARGTPIPYWEVEGKASAARIAVRGGCFCNPGCSEVAFALQAEATMRCLESLGEDFTIPMLAACMGNTSVGAIRISYGLGSVHADVDRIVEFFASFQENVPRP